MIKKYNHYDTGLSNLISENNKIIARKNYELDSRACGLKDFGFQPQMLQTLNIKRNIDSIVQQDSGSSPPTTMYKKNYTPLTTYFKNLTDTKIISDYGTNYMIYRK